MCLAVPMKIIAVDGRRGVVAHEGGEYDVQLDFVPEAQVGDFVVVHAGVAIERLDEAAAQETLDLLRQMDAIPN